MLPENGMRFILTLLKRSLDPEGVYSGAIAERQPQRAIATGSYQHEADAPLRLGPTKRRCAGGAGSQGKKGCRACGGPMWGRGPAATSPASHSRGEEGCRACAVTLAGTLATSPAPHSRCTRIIGVRRCLPQLRSGRIVGSAKLVVANQRSPISLGL